MISGAVIDVLSLVITTPDLSDEKQASLKAILEVSIAEYTKHHRPSTRSDLCAFIDHMTQIYELALVSVKTSSLIITVKCPTLESLERLWKDYQSGCLNGIAERFLVTDELKRKLGLHNIRLKTTIEEEKYLICKRGFLENAGELGSLERPFVGIWSFGVICTLEQFAFIYLCVNYSKENVMDSRKV